MYIVLCPDGGAVVQPVMCESKHLVSFVAYRLKLGMIESCLEHAQRAAQKDGSKVGVVFTGMWLAASVD